MTELVLVADVSTFSVSSNSIQMQQSFVQEEYTLEYLTDMPMSLEQEDDDVEELQIDYCFVISNIENRGHTLKIIRQLNSTYG